MTAMTPRWMFCAVFTVLTILMAFQRLPAEAYERKHTPICYAGAFKITKDSIYAELQAPLHVHVCEHVVITGIPEGR